MARRPAVSQERDEKAGNGALVVGSSPVAQRGTGRRLVALLDGGAVVAAG